MNENILLKRLKNRFLVLNMVSMLILVVVSFCAIYFLVSQNIQKEVNMNLDRFLQPMFKSQDKSDQSPKQPRMAPKGDDTRTFSVETDKYGNIVHVSTMFSGDNTLFESVAQQVLQLEHERGNAKFDDIWWQYKTKAMPNGNKCIALMDITSERRILIDLIIAFIIATVVLIAILFFVSKFFAIRSIRPIKEAWDKQKRFIADASHELKTPLAIINTNLDVVMSNPNHTIADESKWLGYIKEETRRMTKLTGDLLYLAKAGHGGELSSPEQIHLDKMLQSAILTMEAVAFEHNITVSITNAEPATVLADPSEIQQVIMILLDNAIKYTPPSGKIEVSLQKDTHNWVCLSMKNTGIGIPKDELPHIFDRFYRVDKARTGSDKSYGLGLSIAKAIIDNCGGRISVDSIQDEFTCFSVKLPIVKK